MRLRSLLKSKIHRATVTEANVDYIGSITVDVELLDLSDIIPGELVHVWNVGNGERFETYALAGPRGSGVVCVNGAAAHRVEVGHHVIITAFVLSDEPIKAKAIMVDSTNRFTLYLSPPGYEEVIT